jgi:L-aminopeptidase/D-esterase-like protein
MTSGNNLETHSWASGSITDVPGITVGHYTDAPGATGCTVVLCKDGAVAGVDVRGASPGTRETDLVRPSSTVQKVQAVLLSGGSAFGLNAAEGVVRHLQENGFGHDARGIKVPLVPAAILFDLSTGDPVIPSADNAYEACTIASNQRPEEGSVGAGTGATAAKVLGRAGFVKGGVGTAGLVLGDGTLDGGTMVGAIVANNAVGGVHDAESGRLVAGPHNSDGGLLGRAGSMADSMETILTPDWEPPAMPAGTNTTIGVVATNATLTKAQAARVAAAAHDGLALAVRPAHTVHDGDTFFALATGAGDEVTPTDLDRITAAATMCVAAAVVRSVTQATGLAGVPALRDL